MTHLTEQTQAEQKQPLEHTPLAESSRARRILFVCHRVPYPPDKGDRIRSYHLLKHLGALGDVDLAFVSDEPVTSETAHALDQLCRRVTYHQNAGWRRWAQAAFNFAIGRSVTDGLFYSRALHKDLNDWLAETQYDAVVCFSSSMLQYLLPHGVDDKLIADLVDVDSQKWFDYAARSRWPMSWLFQIEGRRVRRIERRAADCLAVTFVSEPEADIYREFAPNANTSAVTNGVDLEFFSPNEEINEPAFDCLFVGYLDYRANVTGLKWFCEQVWPEVRRRFPSARFQIVGRNPTPAVLALNEIDGVNVVGPVDDVREHLHNTSVVVVPLLIARGVQNKILEAMAAGRAVIASPAALEGLSAEPGADLLCAETMEEWSLALTTLWDDLSTRRRMEQRARAYVEKFHSWNNCLAPFSDLVLQSQRSGHTL